MPLRDVLYRPPSITTERLLLRGYEPSDEQAVYAYASDEETTRYMAWDRHETLDDTRAFLDGYAASAYRARLGEYALCPRERPEQVIGGIGLRSTSALHKTAELGYVLHRDHWGRGLVVEAARALLERAFTGGGQVERVFAPIMVENVRSRRVAEKLGFSLEGILRSAWYLRGRRWDEAHYALLRGEWGAAQSPRTMPWLSWARQIAAIAQTGLTFAKDPFDQRRYEALRELSLDIQERAVRGAEQPAPEHVRALLLAGATGYATPKLDVRAAVFRREGEGEARILMVRERSDGGWALPGGWADVGESPAQAVEKEVWEETGFRVRCRKVIAVVDRERQGHPPHAFHTWKVFMWCEIVGGGAHVQGDDLEIDEVAFFPAQRLPPLSLPRIVPSQIALCFAHERDPSRPTDFD